MIFSTLDLISAFADSSEDSLKDYIGLSAESSSEPCFSINVYALKNQMDSQLIKIIEKPVLKKLENEEETEQQNFLSDTLNIQEQAHETRQVADLQRSEPQYIPVYDRPTVQSVGNSGWQVSDIWRDIRVDNFCHE